MNVMSSVKADRVETANANVVRSRITCGGGVGEAVMVILLWFGSAVVAGQPQRHGRGWSVNGERRVFL